MKFSEDIIIRPHITEKTYQEAAEGNYTFRVDLKANKTEIKKAVETLFQVKVLKVNTINYEGKIKRMGVHEGKRPDWKKAIVIIDTDPEPETYLAKGGKLVASSKRYKTGIDEFGVVE